jgi:hypothetical protein
MKNQTSLDLLTHRATNNDAKNAVSTVPSIRSCLKGPIVAFGSCLLEALGAARHPLGSCHCAAVFWSEGSVVDVKELSGFALASDRWCWLLATWRKGIPKPHTNRLTVTIVNDTEQRSCWTPRTTFPVSFMPLGNLLHFHSTFRQIKFDYGFI